MSATMPIVGTKEFFLMTFRENI